MMYQALSAIRRADQMYYEQISDRVTLEGGLAFYAPEFPHSILDNSFREVWIQSSSQLSIVWQAVEKFYGEQDLVCGSWIPCAEQPIDVLESFLVARGFIKRVVEVWQLNDWPVPVNCSFVRILPARAMRKAFRQLCPAGPEADLLERRLDYAQYDVIVATVDHQPAGRAGLFQVGEIGCVRDLYIEKKHRRKKIGAALMAHILEMARRLMMRIVVLKVSAEDARAGAFFQRCGFVKSGDMVEFHRSAS